MTNTQLKLEDLEGRLSCFGEFDQLDEVCLKTCALNINCAIAKNRFLSYQLLNDSGALQGRFGTVFEVE